MTVQKNTEKSSIKAANDLPSFADIAAKRLHVNAANAQASMNIGAAPTMRPHIETVALESKQSWSEKLFKFLIVTACILWLGGWLGIGLPAAKNIMDMSLILAGGFAPVLLISVVLGSLSRKRDAQLYAQSLRQELASILLPGEARQKLLGSELEQILDQAAEITRSTRATLANLQDMRAGVREELHEFATLTRLAEGHLGTLAEQVRDKTKGMSDLSDGLNNVLYTLTETSDAATIRLESMQDALDSSALKFVDSVTIGAEKLSNLGVVFGTGLDKSESLVSRISDETGRIEKLVATQTQGMNASVAALVEQTGQAGMSLQTGCQMLQHERGALNELSNQIVQAIQSSTTLVGQASDNLSSNALDSVGKLDVTAQKLTAMLDSWEKLDTIFANRTADSQNVINGVTNRLESLSHISDKTASSVGLLGQQLDTGLAKLIDAGQIADSKSKEISSTVDKISEAIRLSSLTLDERADQATDRINASLSGINRAVVVLDEREAQFSDTLARRLADLETAAERILVNTDKVRTDLRQQVQDMVGATGIISSHTTEIGEKINNHRNDIEAVVNVSETRLNDFVTQLNRLVGDLKRVSDLQRSTAQQGQNDLGDLIEKAQSTQKRVAESVDGAVENWVNAANKMAHIGNENSQSLINNAAEIVQQANIMHPTLVLAQNDSERLAAQIQNMTSVIKTALSTLNETNEQNSKQVVTHLSMLTDVGNKTAEELKALTDVAATSLEKINGSAQTAEMKVRSLSSAMERNADDMNLLADRYLSRIEKTQKQIDSGFGELSTAISQSVVRLEQAHGMMADKAKQAEQDAEKVVKGLNSIGDRAKLETGQMISQLALMQSSMLGMVNDTSVAQEKLLDSNDSAIQNMRKMVGELQDSSTNVHDTLNTQIQKIRNDVKALETVFQHSKLSGENVSETVTKKFLELSDELKQFEQNAEQTIYKITKASEYLQNNAGAIQNQTASFVLASQNVAQEMARSGLDLSGILRKIQDDAANLKDVRASIHQDAFLPAARFIFESLHTLSVDLVRELDGKLADKTWKAYQQGDVAALTNVLVQRLDQMPIDKVRDRLANNTEFRTYVQRFTRLFDDLLDQAVATERGSLIGASLLTSDIGRIYGVLCMAMGRQPRRLAAD